MDISNKLDIVLNEFDFSNRMYTTAGCLVVENSNVLVIVTGKGYELPKGHVDRGESAVDAAIRETYEETGVKCSIVGIDPIKVIERNHKRIAFYLAKYVSGSPTITYAAESSINDARWVKFSKVYRYMYNKNFWQLGVLETYKLKYSN